jgi:predicted HTH domain antitoxin
MYALVRKGLEKEVISLGRAAEILTPSLEFAHRDWSYSS